MTTQKALEAQEQWKPVVGFEGLYEVSDLGNIKSLPRKRVPKERLLTPSKNSRGYFNVTLKAENGKSKSSRVHRVVMEAFFGKSELEVNHKDGIKSNNRLDNLEYLSKRENRNHCYAGSKYKKGTELVRRGKWLAYYQLNKKKVSIGRYDTEEEAHMAYLNKMSELGESKYSSPPKEV